jgi:endonuclease/exonuclease/phosphatase family metal-dependent hydrolase
VAERRLRLVLAVASIVVLARRVSSDPTVDAAARGERLVVVSLNTWHAGRGVEDGAAKIRKFLLEEGADLVALQETEGELGCNLAASLGWWCAQSPGSAAILSRYPITEELRLPGEMEPRAIGARVTLGEVGDRRLTIWSVHLHHEPYGPYDAMLAGLAPEAILSREHESGRVGQTAEVLAAVARGPAFADGIPIVVAGDWNSPSHLDWTPSTAPLHAGLAIPWPATLAMERAGFRDTFREANPDPAAVPGNTWTPLFAVHEGSPHLAEPQDRIDFVFAAGTLETLRVESVVRGEPRLYPDSWKNEWPSDHAAVVAELRLSEG